MLCYQTVPVTPFQQNCFGAKRRNNPYVGGT